MKKTYLMIAALVCTACPGVYEDFPRFEVAPGAAPGDPCGPCSLGVYEETGACTNPLGDASAACDAVLFVSPEGIGEGTLDAPFSSLNDALERATTLSESAPVFVAIAGATTMEITQAVPGNVTLAGGFDADFGLDAELRPILTGPAQDEHVFGLRVEGRGAPVTLRGLRIEAPRGHHTYALHVRQASPLRAQDVQIIAAPGGVGVHGIDGASGTDGGSGEAAGQLGVDLPGAGGANPTCPEARGGSGGRGAFTTSGGSRQADPGSSAQMGTLGGPARMDGEDGVSGTPGQGGQDATPGMVDGGLYVDGTPATPGTPGGPGQGGGGGGGGTVDSGLSRASGGGGGGGGGCAGAPGGAGTSGGASFGILALSSTLDLSMVVIESASGGAPGQGGQPGTPGVGGQGGAPGQGTGSVQPAGHGGSGGTGGMSGAGGAGLKGPAHTIYCEDSVLTDEQQDNTGCDPGL